MPVAGLGQSHTAGGNGVSNLAEQVAAGLRAEAAELTARWKAQARSHAPRLASASTSPDAAVPEELPC